MQVHTNHKVDAAEDKTSSPVLPCLADEASPYVQKDTDLQSAMLKRTTKSYRNDTFLGSYDGRLIRIMCEFEEPKQRLGRNYIRSTVLFFGSARSMNREQYAQTHSRLRAALDAAPSPQERLRLEGELAQLQKTQWMCPWVDAAEELARLVAEFAQRERDLIEASFQYMPDYFRLNPDNYTDSFQDYREHCHDLVVTTGGGPGFMEAANKGAASVAHTKTIGMGISLPFEKGLNRYVSDDLAFEFHYFFTRKYWMMYSCRAIIVAPGGFGTLDETFELLTLRQTRKIPNLPVVLFGKHFWQTVVNWQQLADFGVVSQTEVDSLCFTDSPQEALDFIKGFYVSLAEANRS